jgi:hypothetical protein
MMKAETKVVRAQIPKKKITKYKMSLNNYVKEELDLILRALIKKYHPD